MARLPDRERKIEQLKREHTKIETRLSDLEGRKWLSVADEAEVKRLKLEKLARKDAIAKLAEPTPA